MYGTLLVSRGGKKEKRTRENRSLKALSFVALHCLFSSPKNPLRLFLGPS